MFYKIKKLINKIPRPAFVIGRKRLYVEKILVEFQIPLLFICRDFWKNKYAVECTDEEYLKYIITDTTNKDILDMLNAKCTMYEFMKRGKKRWFVISGQTIKYDKIKDLKSFEDKWLPKKDAYYEYISKDIKNYINKLENE